MKFLITEACPLNFKAKVTSFSHCKTLPTQQTIDDCQLWPLEGVSLCGVAMMLASTCFF